jgi:hypothetical protein
MFLEATNAPMDMASTLELVLLALLFWSGGYGLITVIRLRKSYMLFPNKFLYPGNCTMDTCIDEGGFIDFILPRLTILSVIMLILGVFFFLVFFVFTKWESWLTNVLSMFLPVGAYVWYMLAQRKAAALFW